MKIKKWISYDEASKYNEAPCSGWGGWFNWESKGMRWQDYIEIWKPHVVPYIEAIREDVIRKNLRLTGADHQNHSEGVPLFDDDTVGCFSYRGWGDLMAAVWSEKENKDYCYLDFYM